MIETHQIADRESWLRLRQADVTASVAGALLDVHPYISKFALWALKSGRVEADPTDSPQLRRGRLLEPVAVEMLREERPRWKIEQPGVYLRDPTARLGATPDVYAYCRENGMGVVQIKTVEPNAFRRSWQGEDGAAEPPLWVVLQAIIEAHLSGAQWAAVAAMVVGFGIEMHIVPVPIHAGVIDRIKDETAAFWNMVAEGIEPQPDFNSDGAMLARLYSVDNGQEIDLSGDNYLPEILDERENLKATAARCAARIEAIDAEIISKIGEHERAYLPGWKLSRPLIHRKAFSVDAADFRQLRVRRDNTKPIFAGSF